MNYLSKLIDRCDDVIWWLFKGPEEFLIPTLQIWMRLPVEMLTTLLAWQ